MPPFSLTTSYITLVQSLANSIYLGHSFATPSINSFEYPPKPTQSTLTTQPLAAFNYYQIMPPRQNPRRNVGAPARFEDDQAYLSEPPRASTKPAWPKLLAQSVVPYNPALPSVPWNTRPLDKCFIQISEPAPNRLGEIAAHDTAKEEDFSKQPQFQSHYDLNMATSESEGDKTDEDGPYGNRNQKVTSLTPLWPTIEPALQLSMYEYVYRFIEKQRKDQPIGSQKTNEIRAKSAEVLGLSKLELDDIEAQRAFRSANPLTEEYLQAEWWKDEMATMQAEEPLSKNMAQYRSKWQAINDRYTSLMLHICKYKYTNEAAIKLAKAYLKGHGLKPKVVGKWIKSEEKTTMVLESSQPADRMSPILMPALQSSVATRHAQLGSENATPDEGSSSQSHQGPSLTMVQTQTTSCHHIIPVEIKTFQDFKTAHDPKANQRPKSTGSQEFQRGRRADRFSGSVVEVGSNGLADTPKKPSKRRAVSELRPSYPIVYEGGERIVVHELGVVGIDVDAKPSSEVEKFLRIGIAAGNRGEATDLTSRMYRAGRKSSSAPEVRSCRFSSVLLGINSDHMPAATTPDSTAHRTEGVPLSLRSTPPQPAWSPIANEPSNPAISPIKITRKVTRVISTASSNRAIVARSQLKSSLVKPQSENYPPMPSDLRTNVSQDVERGQQNLNSAVMPNVHYHRASSAPLLSPGQIRGANDSGIGSSRATSTEPDLAPSEKRKHSQQLDNQKTTHPKPKAGRRSQVGLAYCK